MRRLVLSCTAIAAVALMGDAARAAEPDWSTFLRRPAIERIQISPDGHRLAIAERIDNSTIISVRDADTLAVERTFDPGARGEISTVRWLDDDRLLVGATRITNRYEVAFYDPILLVVQRDGSGKQQLPGNFLATIDGDPEHLLVYDCRGSDGDGCLDQVRRVEVDHLARSGALVVQAPDSDSTLSADRRGNVRFAFSVDDAGFSTLQAYHGADAGWKVLNSEKTSGVDVGVLGIDPDGTHAWLQSERASGTDVVERYDMATAERTEIYRDAESDPIRTIYALDGETPIGAYYGASHPRPVLWNPAHADAAAILTILRAFPGKTIGITSASRDRKRAIVRVESDRDDGSYYLFDLAANRASLLSHTRPWLEEAALPASRAISFPARDGVRLHGILTVPAGSEGKGLPLVVVPHGGPYGVFDTSGFDAETLILASQGFAVLRVNFRGSGAYGRAFSLLGERQWGRAMQDDITDATHWAITEGVADAGRICLYGASYGGYSALMGAVREPSLYRCAAGYAAPYDLAKMYKWGDIRRSDLGLLYLKRVLGEDKVDLAERSPSKQASAIKIPVFLAHGRLDSRVDIAHSRAMVRALKSGGAKVELVEYPDEGHGLLIEKDKLDFYTRLLAFLRQNTAPRGS